MKTTVKRTLVVVAALLICAGASPAADLHPIVDVESGFLFGAISDGKWIKADKTAKLLTQKTTYRVYRIDTGTRRSQSQQAEKGGCPM